MNEIVPLDFIRQLISRGISLNFAKAYEEFGSEYEILESELPLESIKAKKLRLYAVDQSTTIKDITELLKNIKDCLPALKNICARPKSHLKSINEVRPIDTVKRVGYESISYLASHSEDWLARTVSGLKPARLFSRVEEDDFAIYENKVVKTLIDKVSRFLKDSINDLEYKYNQIQGILNSSETNLQGFGFDKGFQKAISELIPDTFMGEVTIKKLQLAETMLTEVKYLRKAFNDLKQSRLYRLLHRKKPVSNPLNETNILLFDKGYKNVFFLWKYMQNVIVHEQEIEIKPDISKTNEAYCNFCKALVHYALHSLNFSQTSENSFVRDNLSVNVSSGKDKSKEAVSKPEFLEPSQLTIQFRDITKCKIGINSSLQIPLSDGAIFGKFSRTGNELFWDNDISEDEIEAFCKQLVTAKNTHSPEEEKQRRLSLRLKSVIFEANKKAGTPKTKNIIIIPGTR